MMPKKAKPPLTEYQRKRLALVLDYVPRWRVAEHLGVDQSTRSRWLAGKVAPPDLGALMTGLERAYVSQYRGGRAAWEAFCRSLVEPSTEPTAESHANQQPGDGV